MLLLPLSHVWGDDYQKPFKNSVDGYDWEQLATYRDGSFIKKAMVSGFEVGFMAGYEMRSQTHSSREKEVPGDTIFFSESSDYYIREIDSFLKTYPLCRRKPIYELLFQLSYVWLPPEIAPKPKPSYKDIGERCLELAK
jgi:hypothetical protein